ncbi:MAG: secondary thiamine-phosphate synthase enzyme YjbQ [Thermomicrobiales bacterium]|nr:secondary thiamine-phosphate synthase enzyme YjbQ [Thermomicrobiales bacterium]
MFSRIPVPTENRQELINITDEIRKIVKDSGVTEGLCVVFCPHSTAGLTINSYLDPMTPKDIVFEMDRIVPTRVDFFHEFDTPSDASAHVKTSLIGIDQTLIIAGGDIVLGRSQGVLFAEYDGPRSREVFVKVIAG